MFRKHLLLILPLLVLIGLSSCKEYKYRIGVSQCGTDAWHTKMTADLIREANSHPEVELICRVAEFKTEEQQADLEELLNSNIDVLIVSPNHADILAPVIEKFYDRGIPVIVVDRTLHSNKYTATVSADNQDIGERVGTYIASTLGGHGRILEITGTTTTSTTQERHRGLMTVLEKFPDIQIVGRQEAGWNYERALHVTDSLLRLYPDVDLITAQNDVMAAGAYEACERLEMNPIPPIIGVDGLPGSGLGLSNIVNGKLAATCINPSGAVQAFGIALDILEGRPYNRNTVLSTLFVDEHNVSLVLLYHNMIEEYNKKLEDVNGELGFYWRRARLQQALLAAAALILALIAAMFWIIAHSRRVQDRLRIKNLLLKLSHIETIQEKKSDQQPVVNIVPDDVEEVEFSAVDTSLVTHLQEYIMTNMSNADLNVNDLCNEMHMSRVQLYRKCKSLTNFSPVEFVRIVRLKQAKLLLQTTQKSISEIAYEVGFSSPSYFAKCYRDQYGISPTELRNKL